MYWEQIYLLCGESFSLSRDLVLFAHILAKVVK